MDLSKTTLDQIMNILDMYEFRKYDIRLVKNIIEILNKDPLFDNVIKVEYNYQGYIETNQYNGVISLDIDELEKYSNRKTFFWKNSSFNNDTIYNFYFLLTILHECMRVVQYLYASNKIRTYKELNDLYSIFNKLNYFQYMIYNYNYSRNPNDFCLERNANIEALNVINEVYPSRICDINYVTSLCSGYHLKDDEVICPVKDSLRKCMHSMIKIESDIPFSVRIEHGLPITVDEYSKLNEQVDVGYLKYVNADKVRKFIKESDYNARNSRS